MKKICIPFVAALLFVACNHTSTTYEFPFQNPSLSPDERAADLVSRLTLEQKTSLMMNSSPAIPEFGIKRYDWWSEALHGYARSGLATVFPQSIGMAASFDPSLVEEVFTAVSDEARAKSHHFAQEGDGGLGRYQGLTVWTPNINIFRDPRWGRGQETYGEDPFLTSEMGLSVVRGLQGPENSKYDKLHACAKHYAVHSGPEYERHFFNADSISWRDLNETYLYAFERLVKEAHVHEVMCAYNAFEGQPCCNSDQLLMQILRNKWGYDDVVVSDCGAIGDFFSPNYRNHRTHPDAASASADAVLSGTDLECGGNYRALPAAVQKGLITEEQINKSLHRLLRARFQLGEMDPDSLVEWTKIPMSVVASKEHDALALKMARETMVLLQNKDNILPLNASDYVGGRRLAVLGPNAADSVCLSGNYNGTPRHSVTVLEGITKYLQQQGADPSVVLYDRVSEWVSPESFESHFNYCSFNGEPGFYATYFNTPQPSGRPVATAHYTAPFRLCTSGGTVFAPGVNLERFSAVYKATYLAPITGDVEVQLFVNGSGDVVVNDKQICSFREGHGSRKKYGVFHAEKGKMYDITINFAFFQPDAQLNVDLGMKQAFSDEALLASLEGIDDVIYVGGISPQLEGEEMNVHFEGFFGGDRTSIELPVVQRHALQLLHDAGKRVVFVNLSGSALALEPETESCDAILQAWYGGQRAGTAVADVLFGEYNPAGRLPVTFYRNDAQLAGFEDYHMASGHTYRYTKADPLFPFGFGLSYTTFEYGEADANPSMKTGRRYRITIPISNVGSRDGEEVVQLYVKRENDTEGPCYSLRQFRRVPIAAGETVKVRFNLTEQFFRSYDNNSGSLVTLPGTYRIYYGSSSSEVDLKNFLMEVK
ncbi:MAG: glycoside hydrolase family 3 C-terminal domain-containing protein [Bacteroidaceae bacterium]|nr:glycoside hydrolase family 3 C-terminal domain-containing protein [Bacteroidaceae bacterium]MBP5323830.1 glycoside hydrolase family 3 C-terminal domain-containing protein [Bacteroidaceae bacterium]